MKSYATQSEIATAARGYIARGWRVLPCYTVDDKGTCTCGEKDCDKVGKHPVGALVPHSFKDASTDPAQIEEWFGPGSPPSNLAIATGAVSGLTVIDVDTGEGKVGAETWVALIAPHGEPQTLMARTGGGGFHMLFTYTPRLKTGSDRLGRHVDVKNDGGYIIAPPSSHKSGKAYEWMNWGAPLAEMPAHLLEEKQQKQKQKQKQKQGREHKRYTLGDVIEMLAVIPADDRDVWLKVGIVLGQEFAQSDAAWEAYVAWADTWGGVKKADHDKTMRTMFYETSHTAHETPVTMGTLVHLATENGWVWHVESLLVRLRAMPPADLKVTWHTYLEGLNAADRHAVLHEVARLTGIGLNTLKQTLAEHRTDAQRAATADRVGDRLAIPYYPEDVCRAADHAEAAMLAQATDGECVRFGDSLMRVVVEALPLAHQADSDQPSVPTPHFDLLTRTKLLPLVERAAVLQHDGEPIGVPEKVLDQILSNPRLVPTVSALLTHPVVTMAGRMISASGIDPSTRLLCYGPVIEGLHPYSQEDAREAVREIERLFLEGFEFTTPLDRAAAIAMLVTAVERKLLRECPGFLITAAQQSLGKTTLARLTHCLLTGTDAPVFTWPDDEVEVQKLLLSTLLRNPAMMCFDNVGDGLTFQSPALSSAMTSATKQGRLLGHNRDVVVSTSVLFVLTGNNVELANDEASRIIPVRLTTREVRPHTRTFKYPDVMGRGLEIRDEILRHVVGIVAGSRQHAAAMMVAPSRFPQWDALVRLPLLWAGLEDVGTVFDQNIANSPELGAHKALLTVLNDLYVEKPFNATDLVNRMRDALDTRAVTLKEALLALRVKDLDNARSVGHALARHCGRTTTVGERVVALERLYVEGLFRYAVHGGRGSFEQKSQ